MDPLIVKLPIFYLQQNFSTVISFFLLHSMRRKSSYLPWATCAFSIIAFFASFYITLLHPLFHFLNIVSQFINLMKTSFFLNSFPCAMIAFVKLPSHLLNSLLQQIVDTVICDFPMYLPPSPFLIIFYLVSTHSNRVKLFFWRSFLSSK